MVMYMTEDWKQIRDLIRLSEWVVINAVKRAFDGKEDLTRRFFYTFGSCAFDVETEEGFKGCITQSVEEISFKIGRHEPDFIKKYGRRVYEELSKEAKEFSDLWSRFEL